MPESDQSLVRPGTVFKQLAKGGLKALGPIGEMINEIIFGTLEAQAAAEESAKLYGVLSGIQDAQSSQADSTATLVSKLNQQAAFTAKLQPFMEELIAALQNPDAATLSPSVTNSMQAVIDKHKGELEGISGRLGQDADRIDAAVERLQLATTQIVVSAPTTAGTAPVTVSRLTVQKTLNKLLTEELTNLISYYPQFRPYDRPNASILDRVASLVGWADAKLPGGLSEVYRTAVELELVPQ